MSTPLPLREQAIQLSELMAKLDAIRAGAGEMPEQYRFLLAHELRQLASELSAPAARGVATLFDVYGSRQVTVTPGTARLTLKGHAPSVILGTPSESGRGEVGQVPTTVAATGRSEGTSTVIGHSNTVERPDTSTAYATVSDPAPPPTADAVNTRLKLMEFFMARANSPASVKDMLQLTGATQGSITTILYKRNFDHFEKYGSMPSGAAPIVLWRLTQKGIDEFTRYFQSIEKSRRESGN